MARWKLSPEAQAAVDELRRAAVRPGAVRLAADLGGPAVIPSLVELAAGHDPASRAAALAAAGQLLAGVPPARLRRVDAEIRRHWPRTASTASGKHGEWVRIDPADAAGPAPSGTTPHHSGTADAATDGARLAAAALAGMHPDGRVREAAVRRLDAAWDREALPYLLVRTGDRVPQVRRAARAAVARRLGPRHAPAFAASLALIEHMAASQRDGGVLAWASRLLEQPEHRRHVVGALAAGDLATRRAAARMLAAMPWDDAAAVVDAALGQDDAVTAAVVVDAALARSGGDELRRLLQRLLGQRVSGLRRAALRTLAARFPGEAAETLGQALFDRQAGVRDAAQRLLAAAGEDVAARYRAALAPPPALGEAATVAAAGHGAPGVWPARTPHGPREAATVGVAGHGRTALGGDPTRALLGLGETGTAADAALAGPWLAAADPAPRRAAVRAVARLDPDARVGELLAALADPDPGVSRTARCGLRRRVERAGPDQVWTVCVSTRHAHVRRHCLALLARLGRWQRLRYALLAAMEPAPDLAEAGHQLVRRWLAASGTAATRPTPAEAAELQRLLPQARACLGAGLTGVLAATLRPRDPDGGLGGR